MKNILLAGGLSMLGTLVGTKWFIVFLAKRGYGQFIRDDGPQTHAAKKGTPTMGGAVIILAVVLAYFLAHLLTWTHVTVSALLVLWLFAGLGFIGFLDDWTKISKQRSLGLRPKGKLIGQAFVAVTFGIGAMFFHDSHGVAPASPAISFLRDISWLHLPLWLGVIWVILLIAGASNAVNLTDGLDGLAPGAATMVFAAYTLLSLWQFNQWCSNEATARCYTVRDPHDLAVVALALTGACFGFLWWNAKPAKIFLGDTGSLAIGGAVAGLAVLSRTELLLAIIGGLFVIETLSVMIQVSVFKVTHGKRVFKMAPLHHHFELKGWAEITVVIRFWIICGLMVAIGLGIFYTEWVVGQ
ncbi:MAG: phospho-N-acetylmuramoyl-pentapeptide-transferase [Acidipropionibacterium acidipropionici]|jgi:phospho-N-acetylmuramoyl-pentapeptide-transferase|uniref:Phospho-N-acetylmuramoyl-pentapeptide-transferase n=1 Tax=Acidipropionibacterium acidipropionici (strain ATCC 4875 / DSM 20272 / JCM 6432 / NBRC 12425 / NCIMB 8070 / 4) TaxID=1171373 RepID=K7RMB8_ACIA4|nr:phospho-N-acetylmuramoyl-pentapeptide-transferase [Acidipropionibacterium acidipropionici]AFV89104.1 Phospho-N-acetylmuramoyl-pentapeptide-transferase [Acidipropionibacterium acidipropionici ATCC 4875]ALN16323.1 phospho-N-acetylmuramoyl-pentapeptide-transferase [Acidipropionibacterium acidipropionici]APZ07929.1 phospho-N-acetylmuramoyl-pentapeptide-transferase [Acidipropionibacterium acidipropionici]